MEVGRDRLTLEQFPLTLWKYDHHNDCYLKVYRRNAYKGRGWISFSYVTSTRVISEFCHNVVYIHDIFENLHKPDINKFHGFFKKLENCQEYRALLLASWIKNKERDLKHLREVVEQNPPTIE